MGPHPTPVLVLVFSLGQAIHMQNVFLPKPSISAEPGPVIRLGQSVTIVCQGPARADLFRLEKNYRDVHEDHTVLPPHVSERAEARFRIPAVSADTARSYRCLYRIGPSWSHWSERSEPLELKVTDEDISTPSSGAPAVISSTPTTPTKPPSIPGLTHSISSLTESSTSKTALETRGNMQTNSQDTNSSSLSTENLYLLVGIAVAFLLCLLLLALLLVCRQHRKKRGSPSSKGEESRPQERLSPTVDITESTADVATTVEALPEENRDIHSPSPAAEDPEEVTYAQLDQRALTRRAARAESPLEPMEPTADSSMYAALPGH